jgi:transposase
MLGVRLMPFQSTRPKLILSEDELKTLGHISKSRTESSGRVDRAQIILEYHGGSTISEIARNHKTNRPRIELQINKALQMGAIPSLDDIHRSGRTAEITDDAKAWLISLACAKPIDFGYSYEMWTTSLLAEYTRKHCEESGHPCLKQLSRGTVSKILSANMTKPHKMRYYLERRDPLFEEKMNQVLLVYREVMMAAAENDEESLVAYISYDEKPGIQAIENTAPDLYPVPGKYPTLARDYEYKRHGTLSLLAGIDLLTGVITATVEDRHRSVEFIGFLKRLDDSYPSDHKIKVILDNHSSHISKETRKYLATIPNRFEFIFTPTHASWLNIIETFFGKLARTMLRGIRVKSKAELKTRILSHIDYLNESPVVFRWKYKMDKVEAETNVNAEEVLT